MKIIDREMLWRQFGAVIDELLLYTLRHVQEHSAQLNMFLGQQAGKSTPWVTRASG